jgi:hypothetical protein
VVKVAGDTENLYETGPEETAEYGLVGEPPPYTRPYPTGFTTKQQWAMYFARKHRRMRLGVVPGGPSLPAALYLSGLNQVTEGAAPGTVIGNLQVLNGTGTYTFTKTADPDNAFTLAAGVLSTAGVWDYEVSTFHPVTITADNGAGSVLVRTVNVRVVNIPVAQLTNQRTQAISTNSALAWVTTDQPDGTIYAVVTSNATPPTPAQVKAGQNHTGVAAIFAVNQAVSSVGEKQFTVGGMIIGPTYYVYFMHERLPAEQSLVAGTMGFILT